MKAIIGILMMVLMATTAIAVEYDREWLNAQGPNYIPKGIRVDEENHTLVVTDPTNIYDEYMAKKAAEEANPAMCHDANNNEVVCDSMLSGRERLKDYYSSGKYNPSKEYTLLTFPQFDKTIEQIQKLKEYFGVEIIQEEREDVNTIKGDMSWGRFYVKVNGENVSYTPFNLHSVIDNEVMEENFPANVERFQIIWSKIYRRIQNAKNNITEPIEVDISMQNDSKITDESISEEKLGEEISEAAKTTKKPNSIIQGILGYFKALFRVGK